MRSELFVANSDSLNRYRMSFTVGALEQGIFDNALSGIPALVGHDIHRPIGWHVPFGLYFEPKLTRLIGEYLFPENDDDREQVFSAHHAVFAKRYREECEPHLPEFHKLIDSFLSSEAKYFFNGCVAYHDSDVVMRIYPELKSLQDKDGLIFLKDLYKSFQYLGQGIFKDRKKNLSIFCHPYFRRNLSRRNNFHNFFLDEFLREHSDDMNLRIAIDFSLVGYAPSFNEQMELEYHFGPKYSDDIASIPLGVTEHLCNARQRFFSGVSGTQFWWKNDGNEKILEVEELRDKPVLGVSADHYGCRYVHSIFMDGTFSHFDGAIRMYSLEKMTDRLSMQINKAGKNSEYTKLFRIDGKLSFTKWKTYVTNYFQDNPLFYEYFGMKTEYDKLMEEIEPQNGKSLLNKLVPYLIKNENGIRLFVSYHKPTQIEGVSERRIICMDNVLRQEGDSYPAIEFNAIEIVKMLKRMGYEIKIPNETVFTKANDDFINFPTILHSSDNVEDSVATTLTAYATLLSAMRATANRAVAFTLAWSMESREVRVSVYGTLDEVIKWIGKNPRVPVGHEEFRVWLEDQKKWLSSYENQHNYPDLYDLVNRDGVIYLKRSVVDHRWIKYEETDDGLKYTITIPEGKEDLLNALSDGTLHTSTSYIVEEVSCSRTGENYFKSTTSKVLDEDVVAIVNKASGLTTVWTQKLN